MSSCGLAALSMLLLLLVLTLAGCSGSGDVAAIKLIYTIRLLATPTATLVPPVIYSRHGRF